MRERRLGDISKEAMLIFFIWSKNTMLAPCNGFVFGTRSRLENGRKRAFTCALSVNEQIKSGVCEGVVCGHGFGVLGVTS